MCVLLLLHAAFNSLCASFCYLLRRYFYSFVLSLPPHCILTQLRSNTDNLVICGQALSHCVNYTVRDIVSQWSPSSPSSITILKDCMSSVPGFEEAGEKFLQDMMEVGVHVETSDSFVP